MAAKILAFAGSTRTESFNKKLARFAAVSAKNAGAEVTVMDLRDYPLPLYDEDLEDSDGPPENATTLYELFKANDALLISSPEYNSSISGVLKNTIDWTSRPRDGDPARRTRVLRADPETGSPTAAAVARPDRSREG